MTIQLDPPVPTASARGIRAAIRTHPLVAFFTLATAVSWLAWLPYVLSQNGLGVWAFRFPELLGTSQFAGVLPGAYLGPLSAAFLVTAIADGRAGLRAWLGRLWRWRVPLRWYLLTILGVPAGMLVVGFAFSGGHIAAPSAALLIAFVPALVLQLITTGLAEEPGWRDFALPRLQARFSPLGAAFILGPLWAAWHLPLFLTDWGGYPDESWTHPLVFIAFCVCFNIVMSWVFNRTGQSLPLSMLMHAGLNNFASVMWVGVFPTIGAESAMVAMAAGAAIAAAAVVIGTRGRLGMPAPVPAAVPAPVPARVRP